MSHSTPPGPAGRRLLIKTGGSSRSRSMADRHLEASNLSRCLNVAGGAHADGEPVTGDAVDLDASGPAQDRTQAIPRVASGKTYAGSVRPVP